MKITRRIISWGIVMLLLGVLFFSFMTMTCEGLENKKRKKKFIDSQQEKDVHKRKKERKEKKEAKLRAIKQRLVYIKKEKEKEKAKNIKKKK